MRQSRVPFAAVAQPVVEPAEDGRVAPAERGAWRTLRGDPWFLAGVTILATMVGLAILAPVIAPHDPLEQFRRDGLSAAGDPVGPSATFPLGTDREGRDYLSRLLFGARASLGIALSATLLATIAGVAVGAVAGFAGSPRIRIPGTRRTIPVPVEAVLARSIDLALALPVLLLAIALAVVLGPSPLLLVAIVAWASWAAIARVVYGRMLVLREAQFVEAARAVGVRGRRILWKHLLPHVLPLAIVYAALALAASVLLETTLSYLGLGLQAPAPSWGTMFADHISYYRTDPRLVLLPGLAVMVTVLAFTLIGDAVRDALDPRERGRER